MLCEPIEHEFEYAFIAIQASFYTLKVTRRQEKHDSYMKFYGLSGFGYAVAGLSTLGLFISKAFMLCYVMLYYVVRYAMQVVINYDRTL